VIEEEMTVADNQAKLKLGKGVAFVRANCVVCVSKTTWEADSGVA
jgi:hypothetical protein